MAKYLFVYHGGKKPEGEAEMKKIMDAWGAWYASMGKDVIDGGNPVGKSTTVTGKGVIDNGGANPASGYTLIEASDLDDAVAKAKGCPILVSGGSVELAQAFDM